MDIAQLAMHHEHAGLFAQGARLYRQVRAGLHSPLYSRGCSPNKATCYRWIGRKPQGEPEESNDGLQTRVVGAAATRL